MFAASELSSAVRSRRRDMGLTQASLSKLSGLSRATVSAVENGSINDLSVTRTARLLAVLGLSLTISPARPAHHRDSAAKTPALTLAARTASVSYKQSITPELLSHILLTAQAPAAFAPHVNTLLEDASVPLLASVVEQLHESSGLERAQIWAQMRSIARRLGSRRDLWQ